MKTCLSLGTFALALMSLSAQAQTPGTEFKDCEFCPEMVVIPPGTFQMGSEHIEPMRGGEMRPQGPVRTVTIAYPFAAGKFEVTIGEWRAFFEDTGHVASDCRAWGGDGARMGNSWLDPDFGRPVRDDEPMMCVYWTEAQQYVQWLSEKTGKNYRLLSEAEWEYAARGGVDTEWFWGEDDSKICEYGNVLDQAAADRPDLIVGSGTSMSMAAQCNDGYVLASPVGSYKPNQFGLYDMVGNVWEWTQDCSPTYYPDEPVDGGPYEVEGECEKRAIRGGSWRSRVSRHKPFFRGRDPEPTSYHLFGFRIARDVD